MQYVQTMDEIILTSVVLAVHSCRIQQNQVDIEHSKNHLDRSGISVVLSNHLVDHLDMGTGFYLIRIIGYKKQRIFKKKSLKNETANIWINNWFK